MKLSTAIRLTNHKSMQAWRDATRKALQDLAQDVKRIDALSFMMGELAQLRNGTDKIQPKTE